MNSEDFDPWKLTGELGDEDLDLTDAVLKRLGWMEESSLSYTLSSLLTSRLSIMNYVESFTPRSVQRSSRYPPESWFVSDIKTVYVPRLYIPFFGYPLQSGDEDNTYVSSRVGSGIELQLESLNDIRTSRSCWFVDTAGAKTFSRDHPLADVQKCFMNAKGEILAPAHVFDSTTIRELKMMDHDGFWDLLYSGISDSTRHSGPMGILHDNTLVDTRPFEDDLAAGDNIDSERYDYKLRDECRHLEGFIDCVYTPTSLEVGKIRSFVHGVRIRLHTRECLDFAAEIIALAVVEGEVDSDTYVLPEDLSWIEDTGEWTFHFAGITSRVIDIGIGRMIDIWRRMRGPNRPSLHVFPRRRVLSMAVTPGCLVRPVSVKSTDISSWLSGPWVDSMVFRSNEMMRLYGYHKPPVTQPLEYCKTFVHLVPYINLDEPPRPLLASGMSTQALCRPRVEMMSTVTPDNVVSPILQTRLMRDIVDEIGTEPPMTMPGFPLLVAYINMKDNYEDSVIINKKINDLGVFAHTGYVAHPLPMRAIGVKVGAKLTVRDQWFRPSEEGTIVAKGESRSKTSYAVVKMASQSLNVGDKIATHHGQKFTICKVLDEEDMPTCFDTKTGAFFKPHIVVASSSVHNRGTVGQIYESWRTFDHIGRYDFDPRENFEPLVLSARDMTQRPLNSYTCNFRYPGTERMVQRKDQKSGNLINCTADYGIAHFWLLCHLSRDKQHYLSDVPRGPGIGKGRLRGKPVRFGEMELLTMVAKGMIHTVTEFLDSYDLVEIPICARCRRLSILCDCERDLKPLVTFMAVRACLVKVDICRAVYTLHLQKARKEQIESELEDLLGEVTLGEVASSFKYE